MTCPHLQSFGTGIRHIYTLRVLRSLELRQRGGRVLKNALDDLGALRELAKAFLGDANGLGPRNERLAVLDELVLKLLVQLVGAAATVGEVIQDLGHLVDGEVAEQALVDQFRLERLP